MPQSKPAALATIFSEVLADLAFLFTEEAPIEPVEEEAWYETIIGYRGPVNGDLTFRCPRRFAHLLAGNLLGADAEGGVTPSQADDAVKEFMNIVCGQFVTANHGVEDVFNLTIPAVRLLDEAPLDETDDDEHVSTLYAENCRLQLLYFPTD